MIQLGILVPLAVIGVASAIWREQKKHRQYSMKLSLPSPSEDSRLGSKQLHLKNTRVYDDVGELHHYQQVSWYTLAFAASGSLFYAPASLASVPLLGYNTYHFIKMIQHSKAADRKTPLTVFEIISIAASLATGRPTSASILFLLSFGSRKLLLQAGNISHNIDLSQTLNLKRTQVCILKEGVEVEVSVSELQDKDIIVMRTGDTVSLEGNVIDGEGEVRQFSLQKQMKLIPKRKDDRVYPFTKIESGCLYIQVER